MIKNTSIILLLNFIFFTGTASAATVQDVEVGMETTPASDAKDSGQVEKDAAPEEVSADTAKSDQGENASLKSRIHALSGVRFLSQTLHPKGESLTQRILHLKQGFYYPWKGQGWLHHDWSGLSSVSSL